LLLRQAGWNASAGVFPAFQLAQSITKFQFGDPSSAGAIATTTSTATAMTILFWIAGALIFARRDVTVAPE
jgi:ABC-type Na+ efflux pump permease subunit